MEILVSAISPKVNYAPALVTFALMVVVPCITFLCVMSLVFALKKKKECTKGFSSDFPFKPEYYNPRTFVRFCAEFYRRLDYEVQITEGLNDMGADLVLKKDGETTVVQVKHYRNPVGMSAIREVVASMPCYGASKAFVICSRTFSPRAINLAKFNRVQLFDGQRILRTLSDMRNPVPTGAIQYQEISVK